VIAHAIYIHGGDGLDRNYMRSRRYTADPDLRKASPRIALPERVISGMAITYTVIPKVDHTGFHVAIVGSNGVRQTILGFETRAEAEAWIWRDKRLDAADRHGIPPESAEGANHAGLQL
jgi:hypothetical protein